MRATWNIGRAYGGRAPTRVKANRGEIRRKQLTGFYDLNVRVVPRHAGVSKKPSISVERGGRVLGATIGFAARCELAPEGVQSIPSGFAVQRSQPLRDR